MKKILSLMVALVLVMLCAAPALAANIRGINPGDTLYVKTSGGNLNLRDAPSATANKIAKLPYGTAVTAGSNYQDGYLQITVTVNKKKLTGWVDIKYLSETKTDPSKTTTPTEAQTVASLSFKKMVLVPEGTTYIVSAKPQRVGGFVNLRWVPSTESAIIERMYAGEQMTVICTGANWLQVKCDDGHVGFIMTKYTSDVFYGTTEAYEAQLAATATELAQ